MNIFMEKSYILEKRLSGHNIISEANENVEKFPGVNSFSKVLDYVNHWLSDSNNYNIDDLRKVLCLKEEDFSNLLKKGYVSGEAEKNIHRYVAHKRGLKEMDNTEIKETDYDLLSKKHKILSDWYSFLSVQVGDGDENSLEREAKRVKEYNEYYSEGIFGHN